MKIRKAASVLLLILLAFLLAVLTVGRIRVKTADSAEPDRPVSASEAEEETQLTMKAPPTPEPSSEPDPEPTPEPAPRPLREISLCTDNLDEELFRLAEQKGSVQLVQYVTHDYVSDDSYDIEKDMAVYLPYGYDESRQYDVLMLLHCAGADHRFWLAEDREYRTENGSIPVSVPNMLDRMIEEGWCRPLIVISPCIYLFDHQASILGNTYDYIEFKHEIGKDLLPYVAEHYATHAEDGSREALCAAREHFGVLGASFGAYTSYISVIADNFDLAAWYTFCGGGEIEPGYLMNGWANAGTQELPLKLLYISEGEYDDRYGPEHSVFNLLYYGGKFTEDNVRYTMIEGWGHEDHSYLCGLFNTLQLFFRDEDG